MSNFLSYLVVSLLSVLCCTYGVRIPLIQSLEFGAADGTSFRITDLGRSDMTTYSNLLNYLRRSDIDKYCVEGMWQFYNLTSFEHTGNQGGIILEGSAGLNETNHHLPLCFPLTPAVAKTIAAKKSYRALGPEDLSQRSITLYEKPFYAGKEFQITTLPLPSSFPADNIQLANPGSYRITAPTDDTVAPLIAESELRTIIKAYTQANPTDGTTRATCYALMYPIDPVLENPKYYNKNHTDPGEVFHAVHLIDYVPTFTGCAGPSSGVITLPPFVPSLEVTN